MPDEPSSSAPVPARRALERAALERVLGRAAELQAHQADTGEGALSEEQILEIGREVGLTPQHIRQALAEERSRVGLPVEQGLAARIAGPAMARASRAVPGTPEQVQATLLHWMERDECLQVKRRFPDRTTWEARKGLLGSIQRGLDIGGRGYVLARAGEVAATVVPVDEARSLVTLEADLSPTRRSHLAGGGMMATVGVGIGAGAVAVASVLPDPTTLIFAVSSGLAAAASALGVAGGYGIARQHLKAVARAQLALEQILDRLERGEDAGTGARPSMLGAAEQLLRGTLGDPRLGRIVDRGKGRLTDR
jgi:hypothetical protein